MTMNLSGCNAGFVILVGDDPGSWGSQNEQDSRALATLMELPWLEPTTVADAHSAMQKAFRLSEELGYPVVVRITRALSLAKGALKRSEVRQSSAPPAFRREFMRWVVLPINVVSLHQSLIERLSQVQERFETSALNAIEGQGRHGIIAAGFTYQKLMDLLDGCIPSDLSVLRLGTFYPFPEETAARFLKTAERALVLEETAPLTERAVRAAAQSAGLTLPIYGRDTGHIARAGELFAPHLVQALNRFIPDLNLASEGEVGRPRPSREPLCDGCPYYPIFDGLVEAMERRGGRDEFIVVGDPGCMVRAQMPPYRLLDVKHSLGAAIGMAAGIAVSGDQHGKNVIALCGDSGFLHSGLYGLLDAAHMDAKMLVIILDNGTTALSGGQPHPASGFGVRGAPRQEADLETLSHGAGADAVRVVNLDRGEDIGAAIIEGIDLDGLAVIVARGQCVLYPS
jgi:indolepyruvate ferredoxin oxidoreductase alpha subunit